jgi:hypothetical protein
MLKIQHLFTKQLLGAALASAALIVPAIASAQDAPMYAMAGTDQQIQGTIASINGTWNITVADASGYSDSVELHQGTVINPLGLTLASGMSVTVAGYPDGPNFDAMEIDTPYHYQGPPPAAVYYGPGSWAPGYAYGWGPSFSLTFDIGSNRFEQRSFVYGGAARYPMAPPSGWQDRPHGYIGNAGPQSRTYAAPQQQSRTYAAPQQQSHAYAAPQQQSRTYAAPQQQSRTYAAPQQQSRTYAAPQQQSRTYAAPQQQSRTYAAPQQQSRTYAAPQQQSRTYAAPPQHNHAAPAARTTNAPGDNGR